MTTAITFEQVGFGYDNGSVIQNASFEIDEGAFVAVLGPNGGGKTTLARLILGLLQPTTGRVQVLGGDPARHAKRIGYVPQAATVSLAFPITVADLVALGLVGDGGLWSWIGRRRYPRDTRQRVQAALAAVEMDAFADRPIAALSGGQRQRVLIARALVGDPEILVLDEPTASIDPAGKSCIIELLERIATRRTVLLVSHDLAAAVPQATGVICVNRQVIHNPEPVLTRPMLNLIYGAHGPDCPMGMFIQDIASALPARDVSVRDPEMPHA